MGADRRLADYDRIVADVRALERASDRVVVEEIGRSTLGRPLLLVLISISSEENLRRRERIREIARRPALAEARDEEGARDPAREGRAVIWIDGGLHAAEVAPGRMTSEPAYLLASDEGEESRRIRENVLLLPMPVRNPDGPDLVVEWYRRNLGTPFATAPLPFLYHDYVGHDNNRDRYVFTRAETRAVARQLYHVWFPRTVYDHHQSGPSPGGSGSPPSRTR